MRNCLLVAGLAWGDEGKGACTDFLTRFHGASLVVRYNGGPQNSHRVVLPDGRDHIFRQFGSGTFVPKVRTYLSEYVLINPIAMMLEAVQLEKVGITDAFSRMAIHAQAVVITPYQRAANVLIEIAKGSRAHGSCGVGLGVTREDSIRWPNYVLRAGHLKSEDEIITRLKFIEELQITRVKTAQQLLSNSVDIDHSDRTAAETMMNWFDGGAAGRDYILEEYRKFPKDTILPDLDWTLRDLLLSTDNTVVFEGSQGTLLDERNREFFPHVTWTDTTYQNAMDIIAKATVRRSPEVMPKITKFGCLRPYATRHGKGPLPREDAELALRMGKETQATEHNKTNRFQGPLRYGFLDLAQVKKAIDYMGGVDQITMSCMDHLISAGSSGFFGMDGKYHEVPNSHGSGIHTEFVDAIQQEIEVPITILGYGPTYAHRFMRMT